jgi:predicted ribosomally synthesized peptide with nif11-like leader
LSGFEAPFVLIRWPGGFRRVSLAAHRRPKVGVVSNNQLTTINKRETKIMSKEKLLAFAETVSKSEELQKQLAAIQVQTARATAEKVAKLSESTGTPFTAEEYLQSIADSAEEMSEEQLQTVAGGVWRPSFGNIWASVFSVGIRCAMSAISSAVNGNLDKCQPDAGR